VATIATQRSRWPRTRTIVLVLLTSAGLAASAAVIVQTSTSGDELARAADTTFSLDGVLDARGLNPSEAPAESVGTAVSDASLAGIADARALNEYRGVTATSPSLQAIGDARRLNESAS
jgi:hypothetical protein